jgi:hypothetical protein
MKFQKGNLVKYKDHILLITNFGPYESPFTSRCNFYYYLNLTTTIRRLKQGCYSEEYLDKMGQKVI